MRFLVDLVKTANRYGLKSDNLYDLHIYHTKRLYERAFKKTLSPDLDEVDNRSVEIIERYCRIYSVKGREQRE